MTTTKTIADLTGFKRDVLYAIATKGGTPDTDVESCPYGLAVKRQLEDWYGVEVNHGRLYPNLDDLVNKGLIEKHEQDKRTNGYRLSADAVAAIVAYHTDVVGAALQGMGVFGSVVPPEVADSIEPIFDGGVTEADLVEATEDFFDDDQIDSVDYSPERGQGTVVVDAEEVDAGFPGDADTFDLHDFDDTLHDHGFEHIGYIPAPGMTQINVESIGGDE